MPIGCCESRAQLLTVMGVDPGLASMGVAILEVPSPGTCRVRTATVLETKPADAKTLQSIRRASDDQRRLREFWAALQAMVLMYRPSAVSVEQWRPFPGQVGHNAWKVGQAAQLVHCLAWAQGLSQFSFMPTDIKRRFLGKAAGDKEQIGQAIVQQVEGLEGFLAKMAARKHEHIYDAVCLAYLAAEELQRVQDLSKRR